MATFYESDNSPIASELVRQGFTLDRGEALRIIDIDERASGTDTAIAIGTAAISLVAACGTLALSGFTLPILAPIAALGFAGLTAWNSRATKQEREFEAEFLHNHPEFIEAVNQKLSAGEESDRVAAAYQHTLKAFIEGDAKRMQSFLSVVISRQMAPYPVDEATGPAIATSSPIGNTTRLGAVNVPSSPAAQPSIPTALSIIVSDPYQSRAWFGAQRTGKSYLAAVASLQINELLGCKIYHINLASFGNEDSYYWSHAVKSLTCDLSSLGGYEASQMIKSAIELVKEFYSTQNAILIVDEVAYCGSSVAAHKDALAELMRIIADKITTLSSSGKKRMQAIWTIAPEFVAGSLTQDAKAVKKLKLCYVSVHPSASINWQGQTIGFDWELFNQIKANYTISDPICVPSQDRICFIGSDWVPVGELPDLKRGQPTKLETPISDPVAHLENSLKASDDDSDELAIRAEIKRFLSVNPEGIKPRDLSNKARSPVRKMAVDDIRFILEVMELEGDIYAVEDTFFLNRL